MTKLLLEAIAEAKRLPIWEQDALAAMILDEIADNHNCLAAKVDAQRSDFLVKLVESTLLASSN